MSFGVPQATGMPMPWADGSLTNCYRCAALSINDETRKDLEYPALRYPEHIHRARIERNRARNGLKSMLERPLAECRKADVPASPPPPTVFPRQSSAAVYQLHATRGAREFIHQATGEIVGILPHSLDVGMDREDRFGVLGRKVATLIRRAGLPQLRAPLRRGSTEMPAHDSDRIAPRDGRCEPCRDRHKCRSLGRR